MCLCAKMIASQLEHVSVSLLPVDGSGRATTMIVNEPKINIFSDFPCSRSVARSFYDIRNPVNASSHPLTCDAVIHISNFYSSHCSINCRRRRSCVSAGVSVSFASYFDRSQSYRGEREPKKETKRLTHTFEPLSSTQRQDSGDCIQWTDRWGQSVSSDCDAFSIRTRTRVSHGFEWLIALSNVGRVRC